MDQVDLLRHVVAVLERLRVPYVVTGSIATIYYGEPRLTNDIDLVVRLLPSQIAALCRAFPEREFYLSPEAVHEAVAQGGQFNIIHPGSGLKVDLILASDSPFERARFARARRVQPAADFDALFASPEDVIIKKMEYYRAGGSEKHLRDITGVLRISGPLVNREYIAQWAAQLGLQDDWQAIVDRLGT